MTISMQSVAIRRLNKVVLEQSEESANLPQLGAALGNLSRLGYWLNTDALESAKSTSVETLEEVISAARKIKGDVNYKPMYPNFPKHVAEASELELFVNAIVHYIGDSIGVRLVPVYEVDSREKLKEKVNVTSLGIATDDDFFKLAEEIVKQGQPFSVQDIEDLEVLRNFVKSAETGVKENVATLVQMFPELDWRDSVKTVTDVLRIATALSEGDVSLSENTRFKLSRAKRRQIVNLLENVLKKNGGNTEDFARHEEKWKRLAKTLHAGEFKAPYSIKALDAVYRGDVHSFDSIVEDLLQKNDFVKVLNTLSERPGNFARRLHELLRKFPTQRDTIVSQFSTVSAAVSIPVLIQMWNFYNSPTADVLPKRYVQYKSRNQITGAVDNQLEGDYSDVIDAIETGLRGRNAERKVFIDWDQASQYTVPLGIRSASSGMRAIGRGSRIHVDGDASTVRLFMHWKNMDSASDYYSGGRVDLDLTALFLSENFEDTTHISYTMLGNSAIKSYHSGDITSAPDGAAEFIDVDIEAALNAGWRYISMNVYNYTGQKLAEVPEAWAGVMLRDAPRSGEIFEPSTVTHRYDLTVDKVSSTPMLFDLKTREIIWWDSSLTLDSNRFHNIESNLSPSMLAAKSLALSRVMTVAELVELTATVVKTADEADLVLDPTSTEQVLGLVN